MALLIKGRSGGASTKHLYRSGSSSTGDHILWLSSGTTPNLRHQASGDATVTITSSVAIVNDTTWSTIVGTWRPGRLELYVDGFSRASSAAAATSTSALFGIYRWGWGFSTSQDFNGDIALIARFASSWTPAMVRRWHADPFGFLRPGNEVPALMESAPSSTPPSTGTGVVTFLIGSVEWPLASASCCVRLGRSNRRDLQRCPLRSSSGTCRKPISSSCLSKASGGAPPWRPPPPPPCEPGMLWRRTRSSRRSSKAKPRSCHDLNRGGCSKPKNSPR
jgi:hypothetical protein